MAHVLETAAAKDGDLDLHREGVPAGAGVDATKDDVGFIVPKMGIRIRRVRTMNSDMRCVVRDEVCRRKEGW